MRGKMQFMAVVGLVLAVGVAAQAYPVDLRYVTHGPSKSVNVVHPFATGGASYPVGLFTLKIVGLEGEPLQTIKGFCVDLRQTSSYAMQPYDVTALENAPQDGGSPYSPMGTKADAIRELWGEHFADIGADNNAAAAFQMAIWEIIYEADGVTWDATSGDLRIGGAGDTAVSSVANGWLDDINDGSTTMKTTLLAVTNVTTATKYQDFVFDAEGGDTPPVPEPITTASLFAGLSGLGVYMRRRTRA